MQSKAIILGCGGSGGVPSLGPNGGYWGACDPKNPRNLRSRTSLYIEMYGVRILIDTSTDLRQQFLKNNLTDFDAVLYTHAHADHTHGIDELRALFFVHNEKSIPVYGTAECMKDIERRFNYLINPTSDVYPKVLIPNVIQYDTFYVQNLEILAFQQGHGNQPSTGYRFGTMAYSTDFNYLSEESIEKLKGLKIWIVDCLSKEPPRRTHNHLDLTLHWIERVRPERAILTHMNATLDYDWLQSVLPQNIEPAFDGMIIEF